MRAAVFKGPGIPLAIETLPDPEPGAGEAVIKVQRCGVCGTDLHMTSGHGGDAPLNSVLGHEYCGEVVALGSGVDNLKLGQFVTAMPATGCGHCAACISGFPLGCAQIQGMVGGFGEYMRIAAPAAVVLPEALGPVDGALIEPLAVGLGGIRISGMQRGAKVAILGAGSIGLAATYWARKMGAGKIVALSRSERRADLAGEMGSDGFVALGEDEGARLNAALGGAADIVFECAGAPGMTQKAIELAGTGGTVVSLGFCREPDPIIPALATWKQLTLKFSMAYNLGDFEHAADTLDAGHVEPRAMVSRTVGLDAFPALLEELRAGANETKVHVDPWMTA